LIRQQNCGRHALTVKFMSELRRLRRNFGERSHEASRDSTLPTVEQSKTREDHHCEQRDD
jgi:hypothetical protein